MLSIDWHAPAAYKHTKSLPAAGFAWEYLRRNDDYRREYHPLAATRQPDARQLEMFPRRWGCDFTGDPNAPPDTPASRKVSCIPLAIAAGAAWANFSVPTPKSKTAPMTDAPAINPILRDRPSSPETVPRRSLATSASTPVLLAA